MALRLYFDSNATNEVKNSNPDEIKQAVESGSDVNDEVTLYLKSDDPSLTYENITIEKQSIALDWSGGKNYVKRDGATSNPADYVIGSDGEVYKCIQNHTSTTDNEPITGTNWSDYWKLVKTVNTQYAKDSGGNPDNYSDSLSLPDGDYLSAIPIWRKATISNISDAFIREDIRHLFTFDEYVK